MSEEETSRGDAPAEPALEAAPAPAPVSRCSICGTRVREGEGVKTCPDCQSDYHEACWDEIGGCATYGCKLAAVAEKPPPPEVVHAGWGDDKECPACGSRIASSLLVCRCGARFPWADPMTGDEYDAWRARERSIEGARRTLVTLFVLSIAGVGAPVCGPLAAYHAHKNRRLLEGAHGIYLAMGYGSAALGAVYLAAGLLLAFAW